MHQRNTSLQNKNLRLNEIMRRYWFYFVSPLIAVVVSRDLLGAGLISYGDFAAFPLDGWQSLVTSLSVWKPVNLGVVEGTSYSHILTSLLVLIVGSAKVAQNLFVVSLLTATLCFFYKMMYYVTNSALSSAVSALIYMINPAFLLQFTIGPFILVSYALVPLALFCAIRFFETHRFHYVIMLCAVLSLATSFDNYALSWLLLPVVFYALIKCIQSGSFKTWLNAFLLILVATLVAFLANLPSFATLLFQYLHIAHLNYELLLNFVSIRSNYVYNGVTLLNIFRLLNGPSEVAKLYLSVISMNGIAGLTLLTFGSVSLVFRSNNKTEVVKWTIGLTLIFVVSLIVLVRSGIVSIYVVPFFRDTTRLLLVLAFCYSVLVGFALRYVETSFCQNKVRKVIIGLLCLLILISSFLYNAGGLDGSIGWFKIYDKQVVTVPDQYLSALSWLLKQHEESGFFRTLWLPYDYRTFIQVTPSDPYIFGSWPGSEQWNYPNIDLMNAIFKIIANKSTSHLGSFLSPFSVKYIIVPKIQTYGQGIALVNLFEKTYGVSGSYYEFIQFLSQQKDLHLIYESKDFYVYENLMFTKFVKQYNSSVLLMGLNVTNLKNLELLFNIPGFNVSQNIMFFEEDIPSQYQNILKKLVDYIVYFNSKQINFTSDTESQLYMYQGGINCPRTLHPKGSATNTIGIAIMANLMPSATINSNGVTKWYFAPYNNTFSWYYTVSDVKPNQNVTISFGSCKNVKEIMIFHTNDIPILFQSNLAGPKSNNASNWVMVSSTYDNSWSSVGSKLHLKAFGFANAFYGINLGAPNTNLQSAFNIIVSVSLATWTIIIVLFICNKKISRLTTQG